MNEAQTIVLFNLKPGVSAAQSRGILAEVATWPAVEGAGPLIPDSPVEILRRSYLATLLSERDAAGVVRRLQRLEEVESASAPALRELVS